MAHMIYSYLNNITIIVLLQNLISVLNELASSADVV